MAGERAAVSAVAVAGPRVGSGGHERYAAVSNDRIRCGFFSHAQLATQTLKSAPATDVVGRPQYGQYPGEPI